MFTIVLQTALAALKDRRGVSSLEYGVLAVGVIAMVVAAVGVLSPKVTSAFTAIGSSI